MRRLVHLVMSPACRMARLMLGEKRLPFEVVPADEPQRHLPVFTDLDGTSVIGIWALVDHLEGMHPDIPLVPGDDAERAEALRLLDWTNSKFYEEVTRRVLFEKANRAHTGSLSSHAPNMENIRTGRTALLANLRQVAPLAEARGFLAGRNLSLADLALAGHLSALDYYGEVPWAELPAITEWYTRIKSRPSFRPLLSDRVPGQFPAMHYAELDF
jgi:glutathione S-transferase